MAKSKGKQNRTAKPKANTARSRPNPDQEQSSFREPSDEFVTDAEIEARERAGQKPKGGSRKKGR